MGAVARKESILSGDSIRIGRGVPCQLRLHDTRVALLHATLKHSKDGALHIGADGLESIKINGVTQKNADLNPGDRIEIGPYLLIVDPASKGPYLSLTAELTQPTVEQVSCPPLNLDALEINKLKIGMMLAACILFLFILLPLLPAFSPALDKAQSSLPVTLRDSWNPGHMSSGHRALEKQCSVCHQQGFRAVPDKACKACHKNSEKHTSNDAQHGVLFKTLHCTECHRDHKAAAGLMPYDSARCIACHGDIKARSAKANIPNVHEFTRDHPPFRITLRGERPLKVQPTPSLREAPGLKFSHQVHLDKRGIKSPEGDTVLNCADCHRPDKGGFKPITMKQSCQQSGCHELYYAEPADGTVPHGSELEAMNKLREFFVHWLAASAENRASCGADAGNQLELALACADDLARKNAATSLFDKKDGCGECHEIIAKPENTEVPWKISPLHINLKWYKNAVFPHEKHTSTECRSCHDKANSKSSADLAMPPIEKCRECHVGDRTTRGKVSSACDSCHQFHAK
jgi:hypothetical protein